MPSYTAKPRSSFRSGTNRKSSFGGQRRQSNGGGKKRGQYIDPARFVKAAKPVTVEEEYVPANKFADFKVHEKIKANLAAKGYVVPTPIQDQAIPAILENNDLIGIANTGTGKTAAFAVPLLHKLMEEPNSRALIVAPTRELAQQIEMECRTIAKGSGLWGTIVIGGASMHNQFRDLRDNPNIIIGTPGRIIDHMNRESLDLSKFNYVVLDEVDRMLDMGFVNDVRMILNSVSAHRQSLFFSATMDTRVRGLIDTFSNDPVMISVKTGNTSDNVHQDVVKYASPFDKLDKLHDILVKEGVEKIIVFDETQRKVEKLNIELGKRGFKADAIHGGKTQGQRERALRRFKKGEVDILVATDVAARGIDVVGVTHVINYATPQSYDDYVHRIGRAGRAGMTGHALTFVTQ